MAFLLQQTLIYAIPLMIVALAGIFAERSGVINLALEGIMIMGAFIGVLVVYSFQKMGLFHKDAGQALMLIALLISALGGALAGIGGFTFALTTANCASTGDVAGFGFLALAVMIFGNWKPLNTALAALLFGLCKCIAAAYSTIDINGDGVYLLKEIGIDAGIYRMLPFVITLVVLVFTSNNSRAPKAEGIPYDKGSR